MYTWETHLEEYLQIVESQKSKGKISVVEAANRLGDIGDPAAVEPLIAAMHKFPDYVESFALALLKIGDSHGVDEALKKGDKLNFVVLRWIKKLIGLNLGDDSSGENQIEHLEDIKTEIPEQYIEPLIKFLEISHSGDTKGIIVIALSANKDDPRVLKVLRTALNDDACANPHGAYPSVIFGLFFPILGLPMFDYWVSELAALALIRLRDMESIPRIIQLSCGKLWRGDHNPKDKFVQYMFLKGFEAVIPTLTQIRNEFPGMNWRDVVTRGNAVKCLAAIGNQESVAPLIGYLNDPAPDNRVLAVNALGEIGGAEALEAINGALDDDKGKVRRAAKKAIKN